MPAAVVVTLFAPVGQRGRLTGGRICDILRREQSINGGDFPRRRVAPTGCKANLASGVIFCTKERETMWNLLWPMLMVVGANTVYNICAKSVPDKLNSLPP